MTMYLPNPDLHPTGYEPAEFIEPPAWPTTEDTVPRSHEDKEPSCISARRLGSTPPVTSARPAAS
jgi:hypothetical protein